MATNKRKTTTAIVAGVAAAALLLGGTFAWTSISQQARNEAIVDINPGGRLHDDFNGTNKDVYVENFGDTLTGVPIYARIRLDQYMEIGPDAGENLNDDMKTRNVKTIIGTDSDDVTTWVTYKPGETIENGTVQALENWTWTLGNDANNKPVYLPTFNMNKDSLTADINGTWQGTVQGDIVHYDDYKVYEENKAYTGTEVYDWDDENAVEEEIPNVTTDPNTPRDGANVYQVEAQHTATSISSIAEVITMAQWLAPTENGGKGGEPGAYWVYDTDGWAYWAQPIQPQTTTGLLLDAITLSRVPDENYYYGINVVGQFATAGDLSAFTMNGEEMTDDAKKLLADISDTVTYKLEGPASIPAGKAYTYSLKQYLLGQPTDESVSGVTWSVSAVDASGAEVSGFSFDYFGKLTVPSGVAEGTKATVTAEYDGKSYTTEVEISPLKVTATFDGSELSQRFYASYTNNDLVAYDLAGYPQVPEDEVLIITTNRAIDLEAMKTQFNGVYWGYITECATAELIDEHTLKIVFNGEEGPLCSGADPVTGEGKIYLPLRIVTDAEAVEVKLFATYEDVTAKRTYNIYILDDGGKDIIQEYNSNSEEPVKLSSGQKVIVNTDVKDYCTLSLLTTDKTKNAQGYTFKQEGVMPQESELDGWIYLLTAPTDIEEDLILRVVEAWNYTYIDIPVQIVSPSPETTTEATE